MAHDSSEGFSGAEAMAAQRALRTAGGLPEERFPTAALVGMLSDEIRALREQRQDDEAIAAIIATATGKPVAAADIGQHYVDTRGMPGHDAAAG